MSQSTIVEYATDQNSKQSKSHHDRHSSVPVVVTSTSEDELLRRLDLCGRVEIGKRSNRGGYSDVWRGILRTDRGEIEVAIKELRLQQSFTSHGKTSDQERLRKRCFREVILWSKLQHKNVIPLLGYTMDSEGIPTLISPWYPNGNVVQFIIAHPESSRLSLILDAAEGLQYLHSIPVVHGDLKGENVLVDASHRASLCDFGMSQFIGEAALITGFTTSNAYAGGTLRFLSPELLESGPDPNSEALEVDPNLKPQPSPKTTASDMWAFGCLVVQILTDQIPYEGIAQSYALLLAIMAGKRPMTNSREKLQGDRPSISELCQQLYRLEGGKSTTKSIVDEKTPSVAFEQTPSQSDRSLTQTNNDNSLKPSHLPEQPDSARPQVLLPQPCSSAVDPSTNQDSKPEQTTTLGLAGVTNTPKVTWNSQLGVSVRKQTSPSKSLFGNQSIVGGSSQRRKGETDGGKLKKGEHWYDPSGGGINPEAFRSRTSVKQLVIPTKVDSTSWNDSLDNSHRTLRNEGEGGALGLAFNASVQYNRKFAPKATVPPKIGKLRGFATPPPVGNLGSSLNLSGGPRSASPTRIGNALSDSPSALNSSGGGINPEAFRSRTSVKKKLVIPTKVDSTSWNDSLDNAQRTLQNEGGGALGLAGATNKPKVTWDPQLGVSVREQTSPSKVLFIRPSQSIIGGPSQGRLSNQNDNPTVVIPGGGADSTPTKLHSVTKGKGKTDVGKLKKGEYWCDPPIHRLQELGFGELSQLSNFVVGRDGFGKVAFLDPVDLTSVPAIEDIPGKVVLFDSKECSVYPDDYEKPPVGEGLNVPSRIELYGCWPVDKATQKPIVDENSPKVKAHTKRLKNMEGTTFQSYDARTGTWVFDVPHFTRYGLDDDHEEDEEEASGFESTP